MENYTIGSKRGLIKAKEIKIGKNVTFGKNIDIQIKGKFSIGDNSHLGSNCEIRGNNISFGKHLYNSSGLRIGGGGRQNPNANFSIGDRCTIHNNFINVCEPVTIGNDVGLSPDTSILTHGYWLSVLEGNPASFKGVIIGDSVIVGYRSLIMMGVYITGGCVIGAQSIVTKHLTKVGIYAGSPAKFIKKIIPLKTDAQINLIQDIIEKYKPIALYHNIKSSIKLDFPIIKIDDFEMNCNTFEYSGIETEETDDFRDYIRKYGIRIYTGRPFKSKFKI